MKKKIFALFVLSMMILPGMINAAEYLPQNHGGENIIVSDTGHRNLYVGGGNVSINAGILGDLFVGGGSVNVLAPVEDDLFAAGSNVTVTAPVSGDARIAGGNVVINAPIAGDLLIAGGTVSLGESASVGGDLWVAGGNLNLSGQVSGNLKAYGEQVLINGTVLGTAELNASRNLTFGPMAVVQNHISYCGKNDPSIDGSAQIGSIERTTPTGGDRDPMSMLIGRALLKTLILFITLLVLWRLMRRQTESLMKRANVKFGSNFLWGLIGMIVTPIIGVILCATVLGLGLGILLLLAYVVLMIISAAMSLGVMGYYVEKFAKKSMFHKFSFYTILWGALAGFILAMIPFVGWVIMWVVFLGTFGTVIKTMREKINH